MLLDGEGDGWEGPMVELPGLKPQSVAVLICFTSGLDCFCSLVCSGEEKIKGVEGLELGLGFGLNIEGYM